MGSRSAGSGERSAVAVEAGSTRSPELCVYPGRRGMAALAGVVVDTRGTPVTGAIVVVLATEGRAPFSARIVGDRQVRREMTTLQDGLFAWQDLPEGPYLLRAEDAQGRDASSRVAIAATTPAPGVRLVLEAPVSAERDFVVRVVDVAGAPVADARVEVTGGVRGAGVVGQGGVPALVANSDPVGRVALRGRTLLGAVVRAHAKDGRVGQATIFGRENVTQAMRSGGLVVTVAAPGQLQGTLTGVAPALCEGSRVLALATNATSPYSMLTYAVRMEAPVRQGHYRFEGLPAGRHVLMLESSAGLRMVLPVWREDDQEHPNSVLPLEVAVIAGGDVTQDLPCVVGGVLSGTVRDETGTPLSEVELEATFAPKNTRFIDTIEWHGLPVLHLNHEDPADFSPHPVTHLRQVSKKDGTYHFLGLQPGKHRVEVRAPRRATVRRLEVEVQDGATTRADFTLLPAGVLQGVGDPDHLVVIRRVADLAPCLVARLPDNGEFTLPGLATGRYAIGIVDGEGAGGVVELTEVGIEVGRTTFVDLLACGVDGLQGRVLGGRGPIAGATVTHGSRRVATDEQGRFALLLPVRPEGELTIGVELGSVELGTMVWSLRLPARPAGVATWPGALQLGPHRVEFRCEQSDGSPAACALSIGGQVQGQPPITAAQLVDTALAIDGSGIGGLVDLLPGTYTVHAEFGNGGAVDCEFQVPSLASVLLRAPPVGALAVLVQDSQANGLAGVLVELEEYSARTERLDQSAKNSQSGDLIAMESILAKRLEAIGRVQQDLFRGSEPDAVHPPQDRSGASVLKFTMEVPTSGGAFITTDSRTRDLVFLSGIGESGFGPFRLANSDTHGRRMTTDSAGRACFQALPPGDYLVRLPAPPELAKDPAKLQLWPGEDTPVRVVARQQTELVRVLRK